MKQLLQCSLVFSVVVTLLLTCGCIGLSIGGKVVNENPETERRLGELESRVSNLEQTLTPRPN